jgi:hypothetical protein
MKLSFVSRGRWTNTAGGRVLTSSWFACAHARYAASGTWLLLHAWLLEFPAPDVHAAAAVPRCGQLQWVTLRCVASPNRWLPLYPSKLCWHGTSANSPLSSESWLFLDLVGLDRILLGWSPGLWLLFLIFVILVFFRVLLEGGYQGKWGMGNRSQEFRAKHCASK